MSTSDSPPPTPPLSDQLKAAMKAFRKRLKLTRLDAESGVGVGPMSGGKKSTIVAISPPDQYPRDVWEALVSQGKLKYAGNGLYEIVEGA